MKIFPEKPSSNSETFETARAFFFSKIEAQALEEGVPISPAERAFLLQPIGTDNREYRKLQDGIGGEKGFDGLFERASELLNRSLEREFASDLSAKATYEEKFEMLGLEDSFWSLMAYSAIRRDAANRVGFALNASNIVGGVAILSVVLFLIVQLIRHWLK